MIFGTVSVAGAGQFTDTLITDFLGEGALPADTNVQVTLIGCFYNSLGAAHTYTLFLATGAGVAANLTGVITSNAGGTAGNNFTEICGKDGFIIPRNAPAAPFTLRMTTVGKTGDGTVTFWYTKTQIR
jgi:hypothetical protein